MKNTINLEKGKIYNYGDSDYQVEYVGGGKEMGYDEGFYGFRVSKCTAAPHTVGGKSLLIITDTEVLSSIHEPINVVTHYEVRNEKFRWVDGKLVRIHEYSFSIANDACAGIECRKDGLPLYYIWVGGDLSIAPVAGEKVAFLNKEELGKACMIAGDFESYYLTMQKGNQPF